MLNKHFIKPLLPGFHNHLTIPTAFFLKYIQGRKEEKTVKLRSDASKITWEVKIEDGKKLTDGWKEFALAHDLRTGDILIFRQEDDKDYVTILGPSCCEIQYDSCLDDKNNLKKSHRIKKVKKEKKKNPKRQEVSSSLDPSFFVSNVSASTLRYDTLYFPKRFVRENGLKTGCGKIVLMNEEGKSWTLDLRQKPSCGTMYIMQGWRSFCSDNKLKVGSSFTFKLIKGGRTLVLRLSTATKSDEEEEEKSSEEKKLQRKKKMKKNPNRETESSLQDPSCFMAYVSPATLRYDKLNLPRSFARANGLDKRCGKIVLVNQKGKSWTLDLKGKISRGSVYIRRGWISFCNANGLRVGSFFTFKVIQRGGNLALRLLSEEEGNEVESLSTEQESDEESDQDERRSYKKHRSTWKASPSPSQNRFVTLTLKQSFFKKSLMFLPILFTRMNDIKEETKMTLLDKNGVKWSTNLRGVEMSDRKRLVGGWKDFFKANGVRIGESVMLELVWEGDTSCVLKFCSKVKQETI